MKRLERHMVAGPVYKHFDLERKNARQAEARLSQRLQRLEYICLHHMKLLTWEQRQLQKELQRLQQDIIKKKLSSYLGNGIQKKTEDVLAPSSPGGQKHRLPQVNKVRALATNTIQEIHKRKSQMPPFHHAALKDSVKSKEESLSQNDKASCFTAEKPQAREKDCLSPSKGKDSNKAISVLCQDQDVSINTLDQGPGSSPAGESGEAHTDEARSKDASLKPDPNAGRQSPLNPGECAGYLKDQSMTPTFSELFVKKGKRTFTSVPGPTQRAGNPRFPCRQRHLETLRWSVAQLPIRSPRVVAAAERDPEDSDGPPGSGKVLAVSLKAQPPEGEGKAEGGEPGGLGPHTKSPRTEEPPSPKQKPTALQRQPPGSAAGTAAGQREARDVGAPLRPALQMLRPEARGGGQGSQASRLQGAPAPRGGAL